MQIWTFGFLPHPHCHSYTSSVLHIIHQMWCNWADYHPFILFQIVGFSKLNTEYSFAFGSLGSVICCRFSAVTFWQPDRFSCFFLRWHRISLYNIEATQEMQQQEESHCTQWNVLLGNTDWRYENVSNLCSGLLRPTAFVLWKCVAVFVPGLPQCLLLFHSFL